MPEKSTGELGKVRAAIRRNRKSIERTEEKLNEALREAREQLRLNLVRAVELGALGEDLADDTGLTVARVGQIVGGMRAVRQAAGVPEPSPRRAPTAEDSPADCDSPPQPATAERHELRGIAKAVAELTTPQDALPERYRAGSFTRVRQLLHADGLTSDRYARPVDERATLFVHVDTGEWWSPAGKTGLIGWHECTAAALLGALPEIVERVYLVGPHRPGVTPERTRVHGNEADAARSWYLADVPGWEAAGHYLADADACVGRWHTTTPEGRPRDVEVQRAAVWFGEGEYGPRDAAYAWSVLRRELGQHFAGAVMMSTPGTTGREAWRRIIPKGAGFPVLSAELRELIQSTSGQGRRELIRQGCEIGMLSQWDMRVAYAALTWGMPVGAPTRVTGAMWQAYTDDEQAALVKKRGRWLVRATVPAGWEHVGILPAPADGGRWCWPSTPGQSFTSWCSASELELARAHGWRCEVVEGFHFAEGKPLNSWKDKLMAIYSADRAELGPVLGGMLKHAARAMVLHTIGAFASRSHQITKTAPATRPDLLPNDRPVREVDGMYVWDELGARSEWIERASHPEWSAEVWGRCRTRLLDAPTGDKTIRAGALHVPPGFVIGMRTDGITLAGLPDWPDDGAPGRYRLTGHIIAPITWPQSDADLSALKRAAEQLHALKEAGR